MRSGVSFFKLVRIRFNWANQKKEIFGRYQSYKRRNLKKPRSSGDENAALIDRRGFRCVQIALSFIGYSTTI